MGMAARAVSIASTGVRLIDGFTDRTITRLDLTGEAARGLDYLFIARGDLVALLETAATEVGVEIRRGRVEVLADRPDGVGITVDGLPERATLAISAEGFHATGRAVLNGPSAPTFTGQVAWRAVVEADAPPETRAWLGPGCHLVSYPLTGGRCNIVAVEERPEWAAEGWTHADAPQHLRDAFASFAPEARGLLERVTETRIWGPVPPSVAAEWHRHALALVGDAAHPTLPFMAQGANLALEDAWVLAACLADTPTADALTRYQALRRSRVVRAVAAADANARNFHLRGLRRYAAHKVLRIGSRVAPDLALRRFNWLYRHDVTDSNAPRPAR